MTLDLLDRAFLGHFAAESSVPMPAAPHESSPSAIPVSTELAARPPASTASLLDRLLAASPREWHRVAEEIEEARAAGSRVIAVTGSHPGEGRTTLARGLVRTLSDRGYRVALVAKPPIGMPDADDGGGPADIVIVDAGIWFPHGSVLRQLLARSAFGCDAVVLVRRADRDACAAHEEALVSIGLCVIGEVTTFARPVTAGDPELRNG